MFSGSACRPSGHLCLCRHINCHHDMCECDSLKGPLGKRTNFVSYHCNQGGTPTPRHLTANTVRLPHVSYPIKAATLLASISRVTWCTHAGGTYVPERCGTAVEVGPLSQRDCRNLTVTWPIARRGSAKKPRTRSRIPN
eukprot:jgi/Botrbrau1/2482/Bobra.0226s0039.1